MCQHDENHEAGNVPFHTCCPQPRNYPGLSRRDFVGGLGLAATALTGLAWSTLAEGPELPAAPARKPLTVKPVLVYEIPVRRPQSSWRSWGGIQSEDDKNQELARIKGELDKLKAQADFPVNFLPTAAVKNVSQLAEDAETKNADVLLVYAAGGGVQGVDKLNKNVIFFMRHKSGPVSLWYEIISPRYLRQHTDAQAIKTIDDNDCVVDSLDEVQWRLRSLCGLVNTMGCKILTIGGAGGWASPNAPKLYQEHFKLQIEDVPYSELGKIIKAARADAGQVALAKRRAAEYVKVPNTEVDKDVKPEYIENAMLLDQIFRKLMAQIGSRAMTINSCMGTIMPLAETSACLALSTLNDDGYLAFCESDFVVIPAGILTNGISGLPTFLNDPTYPHDGIITLAHCTGPRKMDGKTAEPVQLLTHFESDYGAAPKVNMRIGQKVTNILPDFKAERWVGVGGEIVAHPLLPICRCQIDIKFNCPSLLLAQRMPGFHWMTGYGEHLREIGYALRRTSIKWECLG